MGKILTGHYGEPPEAESMDVTLKDCNQKLGLKPSDYVSGGEPDFFKKNYGAKGRYVVFYVAGTELPEGAIWKSGYYLLPLDAVDVLKVYEKNKTGRGAPTAALPVTIESKEEPPPKVMERAQLWAKESQPLFFKCKCDHLEMKLDAPWALRRSWRARLRCPGRCQPPLTIQLSF